MPPYEKDSEDVRYEAFIKDIASVINKHSRENRSNTPDFLLAEMLGGFLNVYENTLRERDRKSYIPQYGDIQPNSPN